MAAAMASAFFVTISNPVGLSSSTAGRSRWRGVCSLHSHSSVALRRQHAVGARRLRRLRPFALAEQQQTEVKQVEEENNDGEITPEAETTDAKAAAAGGAEAAAPSTVSVLLGSYREALASNDQAALNEVQTQLEMIEKETSSLSQLVANLTEEVSLSKERLLRLNADFDNFRKRSDREKDSLRENVKGDVIESLLPMIDNFERAKTSIKAETEAEKKIDSSYQGIYKQFVDVMKSLGVKVIDTVGKEFNPEIHEAIMREESAEFREGFIVQEFRRGFMLGEKLLRPAMVKVSAGKPSAQAADAAADAEAEAGAPAGAADETENRESDDASEEA